MGSYLGWGGKTLTVETNVNLGLGRTRTPQYGLRRAWWDVCFGYVSGFKWSAILYFVVTRSLSRRVSHWAMKREGVQFHNGVPMARTMTVPTPSATPTTQGEER